jgi:selenocysteine lyase/cysteine desulfurase
MWERQADWIRPLEQVRQAYNNYEGITSSVVFSTAEEGTEAFEKAREKLEKELKISVRVLFRKEMMRLFITHLGSLTTTET